MLYKTIRIIEIRDPTSLAAMYAVLYNMDYCIYMSEMFTQREQNTFNLLKGTDDSKLSLLYMT